MAKNLIAHELTHTTQQAKGRDVLTTDQKESFGSTGITNVVLKRGMVLHRLCSHGTRNLLSDYWIDNDTFTNLIRKVQSAGALFDQKIGTAAKRNQIRNELALKTAWGNSLTHRQKIVLKEDVRAYVGSIKPQSHYVDINLRKERLPLTDQSTRNAKKQVEFRLGGLTQYVIPSFSKQYTEQLDNNAKVDGQVFRLFRQRPHKTK